MEKKITNDIISKRQKWFYVLSYIAFHQAYRIQHSFQINQIFVRFIQIIFHFNREFGIIELGVLNDRPARLVNF